MKRLCKTFLIALFCIFFLTSCSKSEANSTNVTSASSVSDNENLNIDFQKIIQERNYIKPTNHANDEFLQKFFPELNIETDEEIEEDISMEEAEVEEEIETEEETIEETSESEVVIEEIIEEIPKKYVALTFDDGPDKRYTLDILALLDEYDAVATFFDQGKNIDAHPELTLAEYEAGCEVENHTYSHINMKNSSYDTILDEINKCSESIYNATGTYPIFVRPPYGNVDKKALADCGLAATNWSVDTRDWSSRNVDKIMKVIYDEEDLSNQVILMHQTYATSVDALEVLLEYLKENGYTTVTLKEMFENVYEEEIVPGTIYGYSYYARK